MNPKPFRVIPCNAWGARPPKQPITDAGRCDRAIFHHTAGHHAEISNPANESYEEAARYAKAIQNFHMDARGWHDSGHNFLVTRNGYIFEGRHRSLELVNRGHCPVSAHCPGQNGNPGVEHEHVDPEPMTGIQWEAAVWLFAYLCRKGGYGPDRIKGHRDFFATACPGSLYRDLPRFRADVAEALNPAQRRKFAYRVEEDGGEKTGKTDYPALTVARVAKRLKKGDRIVLERL